MKNKKILILVCVLLVGILGAFQVLLTRHYCNALSETTTTGASPTHHDEEAEIIRLSAQEKEEFGIQVQRASEGELDLYAVMPGEVVYNADTVAHIVPRYPGVVLEVKKNIGDHVNRGEVVAVIESNESLVPYPLKSLINGVVVEKHITLGEVLTEDTVAYVVADLSTVWVNLTLYQKDIPFVKIGQDVVIHAGGELTAKGKISYISPVVNEDTRTGIARVVLRNSRGLWKPGMFVTARVLIGKTRVKVRVPLSAIQQVDEDNVIFVKKEENEFVPRKVHLGRKDRKYAEITEGLNPGEEYVARGAFFLKSELLKASFTGGHAH